MSWKISWQELKIGWKIRLTNIGRKWSFKWWKRYTNYSFPQPPSSFSCFTFQKVCCPSCSEPASTPLSNKEWMLQVPSETAVAARTNQQGHQEILIKWQGLPEFKNSRELLTLFRSSFHPSALRTRWVLKVVGGVDRNPKHNIRSLRLMRGETEVGLAQ